jgi:hypothetical protein
LNRATWTASLRTSLACGPSVWGCLRRYSRIGTLLRPSSTGSSSRLSRKLGEKSGDWLPEGLEFHVAFEAGGKFRVSEIWDSHAQFDAFGKRLMPILEDVGIDPGAPEMVEIHNIIRR